MIISGPWGSPERESLVLEGGCWFLGCKASHLPHRQDEVPCVAQPALPPHSCSAELMPQVKQRVVHSQGWAERVLCQPAQARPAFHTMSERSKQLLKFCATDRLHHIVSSSQFSSVHPNLNTCVPVSGIF